jgi:hypothetical protein
MESKAKNTETKYANNLRPLNKEKEKIILGRVRRKE